MRNGPGDDLSDLGTVLNRSSRNFIMIAHRARSDGKIHLNDLCGASGRWDGVSRAMTASLFLSHDLRRDSSFHVLLLGPDDPPKLLSVEGKSVRYLNPDERASSALMKKNLALDLPEKYGSQLNPSPGIFLTRTDLGHVLESLEGRSYLLTEEGTSRAEEELSRDDLEGPLHFFMSDDLDLTQDELSSLEDRTDASLGLGNIVLHTNQVITILHYILDAPD